MATLVKSKGTAKRRSRAEWYALFVGHRRRGLTGTQIARRYGLGHSFVYGVLEDPSGERDRQRKNRYRGTCEECGSPTDGSNGSAQAPTLCVACLRTRQHEERYWTPDRILACIQTFAAEHGRPPNAGEWQARASTEYPYVSVVQREFGSWRAAIIAAGFVSHPPGLYERSDETRARMRAARSAAGIEWTPDRIIACIQEWTRDHGLPPTQDDWLRGTAEHPQWKTAANRFGSWSAAIAAAGFTPLRSGQRRSLVGV